MAEGQTPPEELTSPIDEMDEFGFFEVYRQRGRRRYHRRLRKLRQRRALNPESINADYVRENKLIFQLQQVVYLAVRNGCQKPIEIAADEMLKRWERVLDFDDFDDQVSEKNS